MYSDTRGDGPAVLLVHGFGLDHRFMTPLDATIAAAGRRRVYVDLPGSGRSADVPASSSDDVLGALLDLVATEIGSEPFAVVGSSYGGLLARGLAARLGEQVTGLALLCPVVGADVRDVPPQHVAVEDPALLSSLDPGEAAEYAFMAVVQSPETWALFRDHVLPGMRAASPQTLAAVRSRYALSDDPDTRTFDGPALVVTGRHDHVVGYRDAFELLEHYPRATFAVLDDAGHNAILEQPAVVDALLTQWLHRLPPA
ncbi:hydrolase [Cellulomonas chitinilytica]|uniref:Hydrolase n=1 Tax=Cellulomonas chitinilytica TaxID=398759 RepID=A0A919P6P6_9CELL|nr:alpha/beta hydrolase [Cellulomonas chitinilytica]GIG23265.1 hydrolase [Cellulomonas chitinilytica]